MKKAIVKKASVLSASLRNKVTSEGAMKSKLPNDLLEQFMKSGLNEGNLRRMQIEYAQPTHDQNVGMPVPSARIPYFDLDGTPNGFFRFRALEAWIPKGQTKQRRYSQARNSGNHFYFPPLLDISWREVASGIATPILITEGEKKAACACVHGLACIGLGGVWNWRSDRFAIADFELINWEGRSVYLAFDSPDVKNNPSVTAALEYLGAELRGRGALVRIVVLPASSAEKVGLDDYLMINEVVALKRLMEAAPEHLDEVSEMNECFAMVWFGAKAMILRERRGKSGAIEVDFAKPSEVRPGFSGRFVTVNVQNADSKRVPLFDYWMSSPRRRQYDKVVFEPGGCGPNEYNLWRGFAISPVQGDCGLYLEHVREIICGGDADLYQYVIAWMAHLVQRPSELPGTSLVLRSGQGAGKGSFVQPLGALVGGHFLHLSSARHLLGNFNAHTKDKLLFYADEAFWAGDKAAEGTLKALVTESRRLLEHKGKDALVINNYAHLIIASNHEWVVPAGPDERRFVVIDLSPARMQDTVYFGLLSEQMRTDGLAALLHHLLNVDISTFNLRQLPKTLALLDTKLLSMSPVQRFWFACLSEGTNGGASGGWDREVECSRLHDLYSEHPALKGQSRRATEGELGKFLLRAVPGLRAVRHRTVGPNSRQVRHWVFPSLDESRAAFSKTFGQDVPWDDPILDAPKKRQRY